MWDGGSHDPLVEASWTCFSFFFLIQPFYDMERWVHVTRSSRRVGHVSLLPLFRFVQPLHDVGWWVPVTCSSRRVGHSFLFHFVPATLRRGVVGPCGPLVEASCMHTFLSFFLVQPSHDVGWWVHATCSSRQVGQLSFSLSFQWHPMRWVDGSA